MVHLNDGFTASDALAGELTALCRERIADYKCPKSVEFVADLPRSAVGKVLRRELRDRYWPAVGAPA